MALASLLSLVQPADNGVPDTLTRILDENVFTGDNPSAVAESRFDRVRRFLETLMAPAMDALKAVAENASSSKTSANLTRDGIVSSTDAYVGRLLSTIADVPAKHNMDTISVKVNKKMQHVEVSAPNFQTMVTKDFQKNQTKYDYHSGVLRLVVTLGNKRSLKVYRRGVEREVIEIVSERCYNHNSDHKVKHKTMNQGYKLNSGLSRSSISLSQPDDDTLNRRQERKQGETTDIESFMVAPEFVTYLGTVSGPIVMRRRIRSKPDSQDTAAITEDFKFPMMTRHIRYSIEHTSSGFECVIDLNSKATIRLLMSTDQRKLWTTTVQGSRHVGSASQPIPLVYSLLQWPKPRQVAIVPQVSMGVPVRGLIQTVEPGPALQIKETIDLSSGGRVEITLIDHGKAVQIVRNGQNLGWIELNPRERANLSQLQQLGDFSGPKALRKSVLHILDRCFNPEKGQLYRACIGNENRFYERELRKTKDDTWHLREIEHKSGRPRRTATYQIQGNFVKITENAKVVAQAEDATLSQDIRRIIRRLDPMTTFQETQAYSQQVEDGMCPEIRMGKLLRDQLNI